MATASGVVVFSQIVEVGPELCGNAFRHVHHADIIRIFENTRSAWMSTGGFSLESLLGEGLLLVLAGLNVTYQRELFEGEIEVTIESPRVEERRIIIDQTIFKRATSRAAAASGADKLGPWKEAVRAEVSQALVSVATRRAIEPPPEVLDFFLAAAP